MFAVAPAVLKKKILRDKLTLVQGVSLRENEGGGRGGKKITGLSSFFSSLRARREGKEGRNGATNNKPVFEGGGEEEARGRSVHSSVSFLVTRLFCTTSTVQK